MSRPFLGLLWEQWGNCKLRSLLYILACSIHKLTMFNRYPEKLADSSFDNTGRKFESYDVYLFLYWLSKVLLEAPHRPNHLKNSALLTIDLTSAVADEAIKRKDSIIVTYRKFNDAWSCCLIGLIKTMNRSYNLPRIKVNYPSKHSAEHTSQIGPGGHQCL